MKKVLFSLVLVALLVSLVSVSAMAQDTKSAVPSSVRQNVLVKGSAPILKQAWSLPAAPQSVGPLYCNGNGGGCLFYGGDFNADDSNANGLASETDVIVNGSPYGAAVYSAFQVPAGQTWNVTGLLSNTLSTIGGVDPATAYWEIRSGVSAGNGGTLVCSGTGTDSYIATGRNGFGLNEYTVKVYLSGCPALTSGTIYWEAVVPNCTGSNGNCPSARYFNSDVEDKPATHQLGFQPKQAAVWTSGFFGATFEATAGTSGACAGTGCDRFSNGVLGTK